MAPIPLFQVLSLFLILCFSRFVLPSRESVVVVLSKRFLCNVQFASYFCVLLSKGQFHPVGEDGVWLLHVIQSILNKFSYTLNYPVKGRQKVFPSYIWLELQKHLKSMLKARLVSVWDTDKYKKAIANGRHDFDQTYLHLKSIFWIENCRQAATTRFLANSNE